MIGQTISHYKILEILGEGGMGVVYKAQDTRLDRLVALKFLPRSAGSSEQDGARFVREAKAASALNHPNVCTIYDIKEENDQHFLVMEYVDGRTLRETTAAGGLPIASCLEYAAQIGAALQEAHSKGIVHRDMKSENVMVNSKNQVKVMDFGLATLKGSLRLTRTAVTVGTPAYMSPEQIQGNEVDARSDIFSFGVILFEMLTGRLPFRGEHDAAMMYSIVNEDPPAPSSMRENIPEQLDRIVLRALEKDVHQRFQDVQSLTGQLKELQSDPHADPPQKLVAVLPFENISPDKENEYFSDGLTEEIIASLSKIRSLKVTSRTSVMRYKGTGKSIRQIAGELHAKYVLEGSVRKHDQDLRITAKLIDADQDVQLWAGKYSGNMQDVFAIQEKAAARIVKALRLQLTPDEKRILKIRFTEDSEAYQLYLQGRYFWNRRTEEGLRAAIRYFEQAIEKDERYSLAWAGLADSYSLLSEYGRLPRKDLYPKTRAAVDKALEIDGRLAEAHTSLASLLMLDEWKWEEAGKEFKLGIDLNPNYATGHHWYAEWLMYSGRFEEAIDEISRAVELDPVSPAIMMDKGFILYYSRKYDLAIEAARKTSELDAGFGAVHRLLSLSYQGKGIFDQAIAENRKWEVLTGNTVEATLGLAQLYAASGRKEDARKMIEGMEKEAVLNRNVYRGLALAYAALDEHDTAFKWLERAYEEHQESLNSLKVDPKMDKLRSDPRFVALLRKIGLEK